MFKIIYPNFIKTINPYRMLPNNVKKLFQKKIQPKLDDEDPLVPIEEGTDEAEDSPKNEEDVTNFTKKIEMISKQR